jgi:glycosyltransferase involved in cell wall biosynthesis
MKVLIVGSKSIHVSSFIDSLSLKDFSISLLSEDACQFLDGKSETVISFRSLNPFTIVKNYFRLKKHLKELRPSIIHIHQLNRLAYFVTRSASKLNIPIVSTAWGSDVLIIPNKNFLFRFLTRKTIERSHFVTADAEVMIESMKLLVQSNSKYELLQYGIEMVESLEKENVIFSNRLHKDLYRIDKVIEYFSEFSKSNPTWKLVIGGEGDQTDNLKRLVSDLGMNDKVDFVGWLLPADNKKWYAKSKIYISIPISDGTSVSVLEAMSAGCIPVLSDIKVSHEWVVNLQNGIIESDTENPLKNAILLNGEEIYSKNREVVELKASRKRCTNRFIELYTKAINNEN